MSSLLALLNCPDKHNHQFIFKADGLQDCSNDQGVKNRDDLDRLFPASTQEMEQHAQQAPEEPPELMEQLGPRTTKPSTMLATRASGLPMPLSFQAQAVRFLLQKTRSERKLKHSTTQPWMEDTAQPPAHPRLWAGLPTHSIKILVPMRLRAPVIPPPSGLHSAIKPLLRWLLAVLARKWSTSWDLVLSGSLWGMLA